MSRTPTTDRSRGRLRPAPAAGVGALSALLALGTAPAVGVGQPVEPDSLPADSADLRAWAEDAQTNFERFRRDRIPPAAAVGGGGGCDERIGRFCLRHEGDEAPIPTEPTEVTLGRMSLLEDLSAVAERIPGDDWVLGQRVFYMLEAGSVRTAERLLRECRAASGWWCDALLGYALHMDRRFVAADSAFDRALAAAPETVAEWYREPEFILDPEARELFDDAAPDRRSRLWQRLWLLSDPLYLVEGNDRLTAHHARRTLSRIRSGAFTPYGLPFDHDLEELNVRYGQERGYERIQSPPRGTLQDTRQIVGRHHPKDREYLPTGSFLADPAEIPPGAWTLEDAEPRTGYAAPYALEMAPLAAQVARFRRGDSLLVVAAFRPASPPEARLAREGRGRGARPAEPDRGREPANPFFPPPSRGERGGASAAAGDPAGAADEGPAERPRPDGPVRSGVFLLEWDGEPALVLEGAADSAIVRSRVPNGEYVLGLEVHEPGASRAWRTRRGIRQENLILGQSAISDLLFLDADGPLPRSLEEALPRALPSIRVRQGEAMTVAWEMYGMPPGQGAEVTLGFAAGEPSLLERIGEFLRLVEPEEPVEVRFREEGPERLGTVFRAMNVEVPGFEPGVYTLRLEVVLPGRTPMVTSRRLVVEPGGS